MSGVEHEVFHVDLDADLSVVRQRIDDDQVEEGARQWRLDHLPTFAAARTWLLERADLHLDTTLLSPTEAAEIIAEVVRKRGGTT